VHHRRSRTSPNLAPLPAAALLLLPGLSSFPPAELLPSASLARACSPTPMAIRCVQYSGVGKPMGRRVRAVVRRRKSGPVDLGRRGSGEDGEEEFCRSIVADTGARLRMAVCYNFLKPNVESRKRFARSPGKPREAPPEVLSLLCSMASAKPTANALPLVHLTYFCFWKATKS
jgi:hypothetical protein